MTATAARGKTFSHRSRASNGSRPTDGMSRRPGTRVGATIKLLQWGKCPATAAERRMDQDLPTTRVGDQRFRLAWARESRIATGPRLPAWSSRGTRLCPRRNGPSGRLGSPSKRFFRAKVVVGEMRGEVVAAIAGAPMAVTTAGTAMRVEVAAAEEAAAAPVVPAVVATAAVANLMAAVGDATGGATSGRSAP